jgi:hypothetical protein
VTDPNADDPANYTKPGDSAFPEININYQKFARMNGLENLANDAVNYIVLKVKVTGELEDLTMWVCNGTIYDYYNGAFSTGSLYGGTDADKDGEIQYLIYDVDGIVDGDLNSVLLCPIGWTTDTVIELYEMAIFKDEAAAFEYAGEEIPVETEAPKTETEAPKAETEAPKAETEAPKTETPKTETEAPKAETNAPAVETDAPADDKGCASVVGFGAAAILVAAAAAVVLKKKD